MSTKEPTMSTKLATRRVWRTADGRYVYDGHPDAAVLAAAEGDPLPHDFRAPADDDTDDTADDTEPAKRRRAPVADKQRKPTADK